MESPCINICVIDSESGLCTGCMRTILEIAQWSAMPGDQRLRIMADLGRRRTAAAACDGQSGMGAS